MRLELSAKQGKWKGGLVRGEGTQAASSFSLNEPARPSLAGPSKRIARHLLVIGGTVADQVQVTLVGWPVNEARAGLYTAP
jgi:hypothetical protein